MRARAPFLDCFTLDADFRHAPFESCQSGSTGSDVVPYISGRPNHSIQKIKPYRDINVNPGVQSRTRAIHHNSNDETKERDDVLHNEKLIGEVPDWRYCADIHPNQDCVHCPAGRDT